MDTISFCGPCLKWKFLYAAKTQPGFSGFLPPFENPYLHAHVSIQGTIGNNPDGSYILGPPVETDYDIDPLTGIITPNPPDAPAAYPAFDYLGSHDGSDGANWTIADDHFSQMTQPNFPGTSIPQPQGRTEVTLSNLYTEAQLSADVDALAAGVNPDTIAWFTGMFVANPLDYLAPFPIAIPHFDANLISGTIGPGNTLPPFAVPALDAAAAYAYIPRIGGFNSSGLLAKLFGWFQLAGNYCLKSYYVDANTGQPIGIPGCQSGQGACGSAFKVSPPPVVPDENGYVLMKVLNCVCGGA